MHFCNPLWTTLRRPANVTSATPSIFRLSPGPQDVLLMETRTTRSQSTVHQWEALATEKRTPLFSWVVTFSGLDKWQVYICIAFWVFFTSVLQEVGVTGTAFLGIMQFLDFLFNSFLISWLAFLWSSKDSAGNQFLTLNLFSFETPWMLAGLLTKH